MTEEQQMGVVDRAVGAADRVAASLPAQFLCLLALNVVFILGLIWFLVSNEGLRIKAMETVLTSCTENLAHMRGQ